MTVNIVKIERTTSEFQCDYSLCKNKNNKIYFDSDVNKEINYSDFLENNGWYHEWQSIPEKVFCPNCKDTATFNFAESIGL